VTIDLNDYPRTDMATKSLLYGCQLTLEDAEDAFVDGSRLVSRGTALAVLRHRTFRIVFFGAFVSSMGNWALTVILGAYAYAISHSSAFVGEVGFALLGPSLFLSMVGGIVADFVDRRTMLICVSVAEMLCCGALGWVCWGPHPSHLAIFLLTVALGVGGALYGPAYSAVLPALVGGEDLPGAISLNSAQMNASRVIGPVIGAVAYHAVGISWVCIGDAVSYLFVIASLFVVTLPGVPSLAHATGLRQLTAGLGVAYRDRVVGRSLVTVCLFSLLSLPFIGLMPVIAADNLGIGPKSAGFGLLYATFGVGALLGALSIGTVLVRTSRPTVVRVAMFGFAVSLAAFALLRGPVLAYPVIALVGAFYFAMITALSTAMQSRLDDAVRGRVMALWIMAFGGTVAVGNLVAGQVAAHVGVTPVLLAGAVVAATLVWFADVREPAVQPTVQQMPQPTGELAEVIL
jgi:MFS family permease